MSLNVSGLLHVTRRSAKNRDELSRLDNHHAFTLTSDDTNDLCHDSDGRDKYLSEQSCLRAKLLDGPSRHKEVQSS